MPRVLLFAAVILAGTDVAAAAYQLSAREEAVLNAVVADDVKGWAEGNASVLGETRTSMTATRAVAMYEENEFAADEKLRDKRVLVIGVLSRIAKDNLGVPFVEFESEKPLGGVTARFADGQIAFLVGIKKGQKVAVSCQGLGRSAATVQFEACTGFDDKARSSLVRELTEAAKAALTDTDPPKIAVLSLVLSVSAAAALPPSTSCGSPKIKGDCLAEIERAKKTVKESNVTEAFGRLRNAGVPWAGKFRAEFEWRKK